MNRLLKASLVLLVIIGVIFILDGTDIINVLSILSPRGPYKGSIVRPRSLSYTTEHGLHDIAEGLRYISYSVDTFTDITYMCIGAAFIVTGLSLIVKLHKGD